jgi:hypothetical protein
VLAIGYRKDGLSSKHPDKCAQFEIRKTMSPGQCESGQSKLKVIISAHIFQ